MMGAWDFNIFEKWKHRHTKNKSLDRLEHPTCDLYACILSSMPQKLCGNACNSI